MNVSWHDATAYAEWLSQRTGETYRLPTEAEWEYAARAGTDTEYWWGNDIGSNNANCNGCGSWYGKETAPVGSFAANPFGLYDTAGNVWEWTCSEYTEKYNDKEKQCSTSASRFVVRGGSWFDAPGGLGSAFRNWDGPIAHGVNYGFRLARLKPFDSFTLLLFYSFYFKKGEARGNVLEFKLLICIGMNYINCI